MPVVAGGIGVCHTYVDSSADVGKAVAIAGLLVDLALAQPGSRNSKNKIKINLL